MLRKIIARGLGFALALAAAPLVAQPVAVTVDAAKPGAVIDRNIFGQFAEMLGEGIYGGVWVGPGSTIPNVRGIRSDVVRALQALKVPNVRWPGGCHADRYDWRDGIGPAAARRSRINMWGGVIDPNSFGTHEFMDFVEQIGSEAYVSVNVGSGTPQQAADWLEYMTVAQPTTLGKERAANGRKEPWRVKFLGLGNENWGCGGNMSAAHYAEEMKRFASLVGSYHPEQSSSPFAPPAKLPMHKIAVGQGLGETEYTEAVMQAWKARVPYVWNIDALSLHYYTGDPAPMQAPSSGFGENEYAKQLAATLKMETMIAEHSAIMDRYDPERKIGLAIDEWGLWLKPQSANFMFLRQQNSIRDGVATALNFNMFIRHADRVRMGNIAQMVNVIQSVILTDGAKMLRTPTYHVHRMYVPFQDAVLLPVAFDAGTYRFADQTLPRLDAVAARGRDGAVWLALTNVDPNAPIDIDLAAQGIAAKAAAGEVLTAAKVDAVNTFDAPDAVSPRPVRFTSAGGKLALRLPPKSVTVVRLEP
jgi:alpha-L-arabinofuranosidase